MTKTNLLNLDLQEMERFFVALGSKAFHGRNVFKWIHKHGVVDFNAMTDISKRLREQLQQVAEITIPRLALEQPAQDGTR
ncbi:MAG: bifunctional tRNA (adenosine(37)-C2)-methyltransferase TrmG/ribosomal RNA large subunit methyltransferase RlmN, partial [Candidatus Thiodiazotropha taylori]